MQMVDPIIPLTHVVEAALDHLRHHDQPVRTSSIVEALNFRNIEIRGNDPVNALSALLARSADVVSHGRKGWTLAQRLELTDDELLGGDAAQTEKEPHSASAGGSDAGTQDVPPSSSHGINPFAVRAG